MDIGTLAVGGWAVTFGTARRGLGGLWPRPLYYRPASRCVTAAAKVSKRSSVGRMDERTFFLFSDILIYAKPRLLDGAASGAVRAWGGVGSRSSSSPSLVCCCIMPLHHCRVERVFGQGHGAESNGQGTLFSVRHLVITISILVACKFFL